jgi:hypothetical protein
MHWLVQSIPLFRGTSDHLTNRIDKTMVGAMVIYKTQILLMALYGQLKSKPHI